MVKARKYVVIKRFNGMPKRSDFKIVEYELPPLPKDHILVKVEWVSVDPYVVAYNSLNKLPYDQRGYQIGLVIETKSKDYSVGTRVVTRHGWCNYCVVNPYAEIEDFYFNVKHPVAYKLKDWPGLPASYGIGALGLPGATAYYGLLKVCKPEKGETLVVTSAAGAVGSLVGQIAKMKGCKVIGVTGSDEKVKRLKKELGFDKAINYKTENIAEALALAAPDGIDIYFDNVGGDLSIAIMKQMKTRGRVALCGDVSIHNEVSSSANTLNIFQPIVLVKQLKVEGFVAFRWVSRRWSDLQELADWITSGKVKVKEHVTVGVDKIFDAFVGMLNGENYGKALVKIS
ncbi:hypothetical protein PYW07_017436 [Mythimna separata]|uniref:15-oxoprostaglandin 13-reductase n=1 Tax=Mythimna separata TaxID=271217 RepID=A0AAD8DXT1_MYTSE|nr:hypothetical protein PYW07_017436 [Mythimna separata]